MSGTRKRTFISNLREMTRAYALSEARVLETIEQVLARILAVRYRHGQVVVRLNERTLECDIVEYGRDGHIRFIAPEHLTGLRNLEKHVVQALNEQSAIETAMSHYQKYKKKVYPGRVRAVTPAGTWWVDLYVSETMTLIAECPVASQADHDRGTVRAGTVLPFWLKKIRVMDLTRVQVLVDRRSQTIPEYLLCEELRRHGLREMSVTCRVRHVGRYCEVLTEQRVPKVVRDAVSAQLGEHLVIFYGNRADIRANRCKRKHKIAEGQLQMANAKRWS